MSNYSSHYTPDLHPNILKSCEQSLASIISNNRIRPQHWVGEYQNELCICFPSSEYEVISFVSATKPAFALGTFDKRHNDHKNAIVMITVRTRIVTDDDVHTFTAIIRSKNGSSLLK